MGTIQSSVNQVLGTAGTVATIKEHLDQEKLQLKAVNEATEASKEANELAKATAKMEALQKSLEFEEKGQALQNEKDQTIDALKSNVEEAHELNQQIISGRNSKGQFMSKKALLESSDRILELKEQRSRLENQMGYVSNKINMHRELGNAMTDVFNRTLKGGNK